MTVIKSLWAMVMEDPIFMRKANGLAALFWLIMIPISIVTGWVNSVTFVAALSLWALVSGHVAAYTAARVEVKQEQQEQKDTAQEITDRLAEQTNIEKQQ